MSIGSDYSLSPVWCQAITWTNAELLLIRLWGTYFSEILFKIQKFLFKEMYSKMSSAKWQQFCLGLSFLTLNALNCFEEESINIIIINHVAMENHSEVFIGIVN